MSLEGYFMTTEAGVLHLSRPDGLEDSAWAAITGPLQRLNGALDADDAPLAVGTCKDLTEAVAKVVLTARGQTPASNEYFPKLTTSAQAALDRQPGRGLAADPPILDMAQAALKTINGLPTLRNRFGTGHGRARAPDVPEEVVLVAVEMAMMWSRWVLRRLGPMIFGRPEALIADLDRGAIFRRGELTGRLEAACLARFARAASRRRSGPRSARRPRQPEAQSTSPRPFRPV